MNPVKQTLIKPGATVTSETYIVTTLRLQTNVYESPLKRVEESIPHGFKPTGEKDRLVTLTTSISRTIKPRDEMHHVVGKSAVGTRPEPETEDCWKGSTPEIFDFESK